MIAFLGALQREVVSGVVCVPIVILDRGVIEVELPPVEAYYPQETHVAVNGVV